MHTSKGRWLRRLLSYALVVQGLFSVGAQFAWGAGAQKLVVVINRGIPLRTSDPTPTISGATDALVDAQVRVTINKETVATTVLPGGAWSVDWPTSLESGSYRIEVQVEDSSGATGVAVQTVEINRGERLLRQPLVSAPGEEPVPLDEAADADFQAVTDRWRITPPPYEVNVKGSLWDPYNQNVLKGDLPVYGQDIFLNLTGMWDTLVEFRELPTPSGASADSPGSAQFQGADNQIFFNQNFVVSADLFKGDTAFKPFDWRFKATLIGNINYLKVEENGIVNPDVRRGTDRLDGIPSLQEAFAEAKLADLSPNFDFVSVRAGIQPFNSDFKGFVFSDTNLGFRLFGNYEANRDQFNLVYFDRLEKDTNSGLNRLRDRNQRLLIANFYRQDFLFKGYTTQFSVHHLWDGKSFHFDQNDFLARPDPVGSFRPHSLDATYFGWTSFGHIERINIDHAFYYVRGHDTRNPIAGRSIDISAYMAALEVSFDRDWFRPKASYFHASGDGDPLDSRGHGFDAIFDNPLFAGGGFSFWNRLGIKLTGTGVNLVNRGSLIPDLRSSKEEGQPNFVNPGLHLFNVGVDAELTPKLKGLFNVNYLRFDTTAPLRFLLFQSDVSDEIGWDINLGFRYRPFLNNNVIFLVGTAVFLPGEGFRDIYGRGNTIFQAFSNIILTF
ncbi:MAG: Ig-like domain-containing protein [Candidatus Binatia bacterium]